jgi:hypothetical protein
MDEQIIWQLYTKLQDFKQEEMQMGYQVFLFFRTDKTICKPS